MAEYLTVEQLTADRVTTNVSDHEIEGLGLVQLRSLSRHEVIEAQRLHGSDTLKWERYVLSRALVQPKMGEHDVAAWQSASAPAEINGIAHAVNRLSGIEQGADKSNVD